MFVVLGWDGLDPELVDQWRMDFGEAAKSIETIVNPAIGGPHTLEVWPAIITGHTPKTLGIQVNRSESGGVTWEHDFLNLAGSAADLVVPERIRTRLGHWLRNRGVEVQTFDAAYYAEHGFQTIFDDRRARAITVPNYNDPGGKDQEWAAVLTERTDESDQFDTAVGQPALDELFYRNFFERLGMVQAALHREYDLVFVRFGLLDAIGHIAPAVEEPGWQRRHYALAERVTDWVREQLVSGDTCVCLSDHGLQNGSHTDEACIAGPSDLIRPVDSVLDIKGLVDEHAPTSDPVSPVPLRDVVRFDAEVAPRASPQSVEEELRALGYID